MKRTAQFLAVFLLGISAGVIATAVVPSVLTPSKPAPFSQVGTQMDFQEDWPLTVRAVMLTCEPPSTVVFTTQDGTRYGLNGLKTVYNDINAIWAPDPVGGKRNFEPPWVLWRLG